MWQHIATRRNMVAKRAKHDTPNNVAICYIEMLRSFDWGFRQRRIWLFHVVVLPRTAKKCTKIYNARAQTLFFSLTLLFSNVFFAVAIVVFLNSLFITDQLLYKILSWLLNIGNKTTEIASRIRDE